VDGERVRSRTVFGRRWLGDTAYSIDVPERRHEVIVEFGASIE
jgi:hypothetical protein